MDYIKRTEKLGAIFTYCGFLLLLAVPVVISIAFDVWPTFGEIMLAVLPTLAVYVPVQIIEMVTYIPLLGRGGSYLAFITGNITNLKAPVAMNTLKTAEVEAGTEEGEIVTTLSVATSALVTNVVLAIGVILFLVSGLADVISAPVLAPAFDNLLAALFGAMGVVFIGKNWKIAIAPIAVMLAIFFIVGSSTYTKIASVLVPVAALVAIGVARILYKKNLL